MAWGCRICGGRAIHISFVTSSYKNTQTGNGSVVKDLTWVLASGSHEAFEMGWSVGVEVLELKYNEGAPSKLLAR